MDRRQTRRHVGVDARRSCSQPKNLNYEQTSRRTQEGLPNDGVAQIASSSLHDKIEHLQTRTTLLQARDKTAR